MKREEAVALIKELVSNNLIEVSWLSIEERKANSYELRFKGDVNRYLIETYLEKHNLALQEIKEKEILVIFKP